MSTSLRRRVYEALDPRGKRGLSGINLVLMLFIVTSVAMAIVETEDTVSQAYPTVFNIAEVVFAVVFGVEYLTRLWVAPEDPRCGTGWKARLRWMASPTAIIDLLALAPALLLTGGSPSYLLRVFRLLRIIRLAKLGRFSKAFSLVVGVVASRRFELLVTLAAAGVALLGSATLLYMVEGSVQPDKFGSIPRALWWAVITMTTIGYGDVYPTTALGRFIGGVTAIIGIGLIAAPTGILAGAFSEALRGRRLDEDEEPKPDA